MQENMTLQVIAHVENDYTGKFGIPRQSGMVGAVSEIVFMPEYRDANALRGEILYAAREDLPIEEGAHFIADLLGLPVMDANDGKVYGTLKAVTDAAAGQLYEVKTENGIVLLPVVPQFVKEVDQDKGIFITPIPGFFDEI